MHNIFFNLTGLMGLLLIALSLARQVSWKFENVGVTILQYGLLFEAVLLFHYGLLWEVIH